MTRKQAPLAFAIVLTIAAGGAFADKPPWAGEGKKQGAHREQTRYDAVHGSTVTFRFTSQDRLVVAEYYGAQAGKGKCPPGLAKKNNGCQPPGQAKKWQKGHPLPADVRYYELPSELRIRLPLPPPNYRYVQIAGDILLIAVGTRMVVDAMEDILH